MQKANIIAKFLIQRRSSVPGVLEEAKERNRFLIEELKKDDRKFNVKLLKECNEEIGLSIDLGEFFVNSGRIFEIPDLLFEEMQKEKDNVQFFILCKEYKVDLSKDNCVKVFSIDDPGDFITGGQNFLAYLSPNNEVFETILYRTGELKIYKYTAYHEESFLTLKREPVSTNSHSWELYLGNRENLHFKTVVRAAKLLKENEKLLKKVLVAVNV